MLPILLIGAIVTAVMFITEHFRNRRRNDGDALGPKGPRK